MGHWLNVSKFLSDHKNYPALLQHAQQQIISFIQCNRKTWGTYRSLSIKELIKKNLPFLQTITPQVASDLNLQLQSIFASVRIGHLQSKTALFLKEHHYSTNATHFFFDNDELYNLNFNIISKNGGMPILTNQFIKGKRIIHFLKQRKIADTFIVAEENPENNEKLFIHIITADNQVVVSREKTACAQLATFGSDLMGLSNDGKIFSINLNSPTDTVLTAHIDQNITRAQLFEHSEISKGIIAHGNSSNNNADSDKTDYCTMYLISNDNTQLKVTPKYTIYSTEYKATSLHPIKPLIVFCHPDKSYTITNFINANVLHKLSFTLLPEQLYLSENDMLAGISANGEVELKELNDQQSFTIAHKSFLPSKTSLCISHLNKNKLHLIMQNKIFGAKLHKTIDLAALKKEIEMSQSLSITEQIERTLE
jgi:hypothetical protein